jgi:uncharacterized protein YndB with AHSA1/START domain
MTPKTAEREDVVLSRVLDAPRPIVFKCWTDPKHFAKWFGPKDWTTPVCELDARPGGDMRIVMRGPKGQEQQAPGEFQEVVPFSRIVFRSYFGDKSNPMFEVIQTVTLDEETPSRTKLTLRLHVTKVTPDMEPMLGGMSHGWLQSFDKLASEVVAAAARRADHSTFTITRDFKAPVALVYKSFAELKAKKKWFVGPEGWDSGEHTMDFRVGGRETESGGPPGGPVHYYNAVYQNIVPEERIIYSYDMLLDERPISVSLATLEFRRNGTGTTLVLTEQGVFLDGFDDAGGREQGTRELLTQLEKALDA